MDVNQTKFHLIYGCDDWSRWRLNGGTDSLATLWAEDSDPPLEWDRSDGTLRLARAVPLFRRGDRVTPLRLSQRRGAGRDAYGNWYWIDEEESGLRFLPSGAAKSMPYWSSLDRNVLCTPTPPGAFGAKPAAAPKALRLQALAVTTRHFLVVGDLTQHGLLVFDLHGGGDPLLVRWPDDVPFAPWDMAATPDGGLLVLDRDHLTYWRLDANFRLEAEAVDGDLMWFSPSADDDPQPLAKQRARPRGFQLTGESPPAALSPVSIEPGPDGTVLILDTAATRAYSIIYRYRGAQRIAAYSLENAITVTDPEAGEGSFVQFSVVGHDFAYCQEPLAVQTGPGGVGMAGCGSPAFHDGDAGGETLSFVYVAEQDGNQVMAFLLDETAGRLVEQREYLPLRRWQAKALVCAGGKVYYDFADRWVSLQPFMDCQYAGRAVITTPPDAWQVASNAVPGGPFDSSRPGCVWHRLMLDAQIPANTAILVRARAADDPALLTQMGWIPQPRPYLRSGGCEIPYFNPWSDLDPLPERAGTWELLFQDIRGRYLQLELTLIGTGRSTPALRALRAWYPRFSYSEQYLPAIYREEPAAASFMERWLANFEGFYTDLEDRIQHVWALFDPQTAPAETLDWLACWFGVVLDPLWDEDRRRFFIRHADRLFRRRGTLPGVEIAVRLYLDQLVDDWLLDAACRDSGRVRIVERFRARGIGGLVLGDPTEPATGEDPAAAAHRFTVLLPHDLDEEQLAMVERIVELEKPAHTEFELKRYWDLFRVGEARLGLDTRLGYSSRFTPMVLGGGGPLGLAGVYLPARYPFDIEDRVVIERDHLGDLRPL